MKISIVTPCFNYGRFLPDAVDSVRSQLTEAARSKKVSIEHIVIDAGSTDGTVEWLHEYVAKQTAIPGYHFSFISEPDKGQTHAINKGLRMTTGDVVCWLNADEHYQPAVLEKISIAFEKNPQADVIYGEPVFTDTTGKIIKEKKEHRFDRRVLLYYGCYITSCCTFWRRRILDAGHFLDESYKATMDFEYYVRLMDLGYHFLFLPETIAAFMWHEENVSTVFADIRYKERIHVQRMYGFRLPLFKETPEWLLHGLHLVFKAKRLILTMPRRIVAEIRRLSASSK